MLELLRFQIDYMELLKEYLNLNQRLSFDDLLFEEILLN